MFSLLSPLQLATSIAAGEGGAWKAVVASAEEGVVLTKTMKPLAGRSSYMQQDSTDGTEDPGAAAVAMAMKAFAKAFQEGESGSNL